jgi:hypothetical protein
LFGGCCGVAGVGRIAVVSEEWPSVAFSRGLELLGSESWSDAITTLRTALRGCGGPERVAHQAECLHWIGMAYLSLEEFEEAVQSFCGAMDMMSGSVETELHATCAELAAVACDE